MKSDMMLAVLQLAAERELPQDAVISVIEDAIAAAHRREEGVEGQDVSASLDPETGKVTIDTVVHVVDVVEEDGPPGQVTVDEARALMQKADAAGSKIRVEVGDSIVTGHLEFKPQRIASRVTSQFLKQRLRSEERKIVFEQFADKEGEIISAPVRRVESVRSENGSSRGTVVVDLGKADAFLPEEEQSPSERYRPGLELKLYVLKVSDPQDQNEDRPEILVSRTHKNLLRRLMENEVPEIKSGLVEIRGIARDPGARSKVAVYSNRRDIDAIGACVGLRGIRVQNVVTELMGEKIDILEWSDDVNAFITNALSPATVDEVVVLGENEVEVVVPDSAVHVAIGKEGQNVGLAVSLTGCAINIKSASVYAEEQLLLRQELEAEEAERRAAEEAKALEAEAAALAAAEAETAAETEAQAAVVEVVAETEDETETAEVAEVEQIDAEAAVEVAEAEPPSVPATPTIFTPSSPLTEVATLDPEVAEEESEEELSRELAEIEEQIREIEVEEREREEAAREAQERADLDQFINSDEIWAVPGELDDDHDDSASSLTFAEDIVGYRDSDSDRSQRRGGGRRGGQRGARR